MDDGSDVAQEIWCVVRDENNGKNLFPVDTNGKFSEEACVVVAADLTASKTTDAVNFLVCKGTFDEVLRKHKAA